MFEAYLFGKDITVVGHQERAEVIENIKLRKRSSVWLLAAHTLSPLSAGQQHS